MEGGPVSVGWGWVAAHTILGWAVVNGCALAHNILAPTNLLTHPTLAHSNPRAHARTHPHNRPPVHSPTGPPTHLPPHSQVLATGGKSFPKLGATGTGYEVAAQLGHTLHPPYPALTPLIGRHPGGQQLAGVSLYGVSLTCVQPQQAQQPAGSGGGGGRRRRGQQRAVRAQRSGLLFTHKGYSGPAILDLSHNIIKALERGEAPPGASPRPKARGWSGGRVLSVLRLSWPGLERCCGSVCPCGCSCNVERTTRPASPAWPVLYLRSGQAPHPPSEAATLLVDWNCLILFSLQSCYLPKATFF